MRWLVSPAGPAALCIFLIACTATVVPTPSRTPSPRGQEARLIERACHDTTYAACAGSLRTALDVFAGELVAVCEYGDGTGDVVLIQKRREAKATCSGDGLIAPSRVVIVLKLPKRVARQSPPMTPLRNVVLSGTGDKTGPAVILEGSYTITSKVTAKPGCSWTLSVRPGYGNVVSVSTDAAGSQEQTLPISLDRGSYRIVVTSSECANWYVSITR